MAICRYYKYIIGALKWPHRALLNYFEALHASSAVSAPELYFTIFGGLYNKLRDEFQNLLKSIMCFCLKFWTVQIFQISICHNPIIKTVNQRWLFSCVYSFIFIFSWCKIFILFQGSYGIVKLAYNEEDETHYVSTFYFI